MMQPHRPITLIILDGWGYREETRYNAIRSAHTPNWDYFWQHYPHTLLEGSGHAVGLPDGQMGNSEVGHLNIGAGRIVDQDFTRIDKAIENDEFFHNPIFCKTIDQAIANNKAVHVLGLLSPGGIHSHERHIHSIIKLAAQRGLKKLYLHPFLDGRDTPPRSATTSLTSLENIIAQYQCGQIVSLIGRYYAMDRDNRWERTRAAYDLLTHAKADYHAPNALTALALAYERGEDDEFVRATTIYEHEPITIEDGDSIIFMNFRADRTRQLTHAFIDTTFTHFNRDYFPTLQHFVSLTEYATDLPTLIAFPSIPLTNILSECLAQQQLKQLRIAETEKYAHVTFFFNGGKEQPFPGEERVLINSPRVATYDLLPQMSAETLTEELIARIKSQQYDVIICNYANADMVGHSGNFAATVQAIETLDDCLGRVVKALQEINGEAIITADHGNAECMYDETTRQPHTAHTSDPVPFLYIGRPASIRSQDSSAKNTLADIAPTILYLLQLAPPQEMTGHYLLQLTENKS